MAIRVLGYSNPVCPAKIEGTASLIQQCDFRSYLGQIERILFLKKNAVNPFDTTTILVEGTWDTLLALDVTDDPDNALFTPTLYNSSSVGGEPNTNETTSGKKSTNFYADSVLSIQFKNLPANFENQLIADIRDNETNLKCIFVTDNGSILYRSTESGTEVGFFRIRYATLNERNAEGRNVEINMGALHFQPEELTNFVLVSPSFDLLQK